MLAFLQPVYEKLAAIQQLLAGGPPSVHGPGSGHYTHKYHLPIGVGREAAKRFPLHSSWHRHPNWKQHAYGGVVVNNAGQFLLREPAGHFDSYSWTWPKGKLDSETEHPVDAALREVQQETGYRTRIFDAVPGTFTSGTGSRANFYLMRSHGQVNKPDWETGGLRWANYDEAKKLISQSPNSLGRLRDLAILEYARHRIHQYKTQPGPVTASAFTLSSLGQKLIQLGDGLESYLFTISCEGDAWDPAAHPRVPKGSGKGGEFAPKHSGTVSGTFHKHSSLLKAYGFKQTAQHQIPDPKNPGKKLTELTVWQHPVLGRIEVNPMNNTFQHFAPGNEPLKQSKTGSFNKLLQEHLNQQVSKLQTPIENPAQPSPVAKTTVSPTGTDRTTLHHTGAKFGYTPTTYGKRHTVHPSGAQASLYSTGEWFHYTPQGEQIGSGKGSQELHDQLQSYNQAVADAMGDALTKAGYKPTEVLSNLGGVTYEHPQKPDVFVSNKLGKWSVLDKAENDAATGYDVASLQKHVQQTQPTVEEKQGPPPPNDLAQHYTHAKYGHTYQWDPQTQQYHSSQGKMFPPSKMNWMVKNDIVQPSLPTESKVAQAYSKALGETAEANGYKPTGSAPGALVYKHPTTGHTVLVTGNGWTLAGPSGVFKTGKEPQELHEALVSNNNQEKAQFVKDAETLGQAYGFTQPLSSALGNKLLIHPSTQHKLTIIPELHTWEHSDSGNRKVASGQTVPELTNHLAIHPPQSIVTPAKTPAVTTEPLKTPEPQHSLPGALDKGGFKQIFQGKIKTKFQNPNGDLIERFKSGKWKYKPISGPLHNGYSTYSLVSKLNQADAAHVANHNALVEAGYVNTTTLNKHKPGFPQMYALPGAPPGNKVVLQPSGHWSTFQNHHKIHEGFGSQALNEKLGYPAPAVKEAPAAGFTYAGDAKSLGGAHSKYFFTQGGQTYLFKPSETIGGKVDEVFAHADAMASKVGNAVAPGSVPQTTLAKVDVPGKGQMFGSMQKFIPKTQVAEFGFSNPTSLTADDIKGLQQQHVVDWLISNHDAHGNQFLKLKDGPVVGIDKSQAFKFFPGDQLSLTYHPNKQEAPPYYNQLFQSVKDGKIQLDPNNALPAIHKAMAISDTDYSKMLTDYAVSRFKTPTEANQFLVQATARKNDLQKDMEKFYATVTGKKDFQFPQYVPQKPADQYPEPPVKGGVALPMHQMLTDNGYSFYNYGSKTAQPKYKDAEGKTVYVAGGDNQWTYYPMGSTSMNSYGSSSGKGITSLEAALKQPFEKPTSEVTHSYSEGMTPGQHTAEEALPTVPYSPPPKVLTELPDGYTTGGDPVVYIHNKPTTGYSATEKSIIKSYQGAYSGTLNKHAAVNMSDFIYAKHSDSSVSDKVMALDSAMQKGVLNRNTLLFRGVPSDLGLDIKKLVLSGATEYIPKSFLSTSVNQSLGHNWGGDVTLKIWAPKGTHAVVPSMVTGSYSGAHGESEVILPRNLVYKVKGAYKSGGQFYVDLDAVDPTNKDVQAGVSLEQEMMLV